MINILYITYDGLTDQLGQSQVLPYLVGLAGKGYSIHILSFEKKKVLAKKKGIIEKHLNGKKIYWHKKYYTKFPPILSTIYDIWSLKKEAKRIYKKHEIQLVHCRSYIAALGGLYLKRKFKLPFIFDMRGFWADERVDGNIWNLNNPVFRQVYNYFKSKEQQYLTESDSIISLTKAGKDVIESYKLNKLLPNIDIIPCCADFEHFCRSDSQKSKSKELKSELNIHHNDFIISYLGSIGTWYMLEEMLDFFVILVNNKPNSKFLFITGESEEMIHEIALKKNIDLNCLIVKQAAREEVPAYIALSNISIFFIKPVFSKKASSPTKMAEIMGMGIPIICNSNVGDVEEILNETQLSLLVHEFNNETYQEVINQIDDLFKKDSLNIRQVAKDRFSLKDGVDTYDRIYKKLAITN